MRGRSLLAVVLAAAVVSAAVYYGRERNGSGQSDSTRQALPDGARSAEPVRSPVTAAPSADQREERAADQLEAAAPEPAQAVASDEQIRAFTIPLERAVAGFDDVKLKVSVRPIPEFKETLRQFAAESDDPGWSSETEARIYGEISQATGLSAVDIQVDCRTTMCRVLLTKPSSSPSARYRSFNELVDSFGLKTIWILAVPDENGTPVNFAYLRRGD